jgi:hypothetical protein
VCKLNWVTIVGIVVVSLSGSTSIAKEKYQTHSISNPGLQCVLAERQRNLVRDPVNYPGAYEHGYQQGTEARTRGASSQSPTADGEVARGYADAYQLKPYAGQKSTVPSTNNVKCGCRLRIFKDVLFRSEIEATCQSEKQEISSSQSDAYHPQAYNDGYRGGIASKARNETYQPRTVGGEFARGWEDGYFGRRNSGQRYTELPIKDYNCRCNLVIRQNNIDEEF